MQDKEKENLIFIKLDPDEDVFLKLKQVCKKYKIESAVILSGIGQLKKAELGYFKEKGNYTPECFEKPLELLSLTGNICKKEKDEHIFHIHAVLGDEHKNAIGGHFISGIISVTAEIIIFKTNLGFKRKINKKTGLQSIELN